MPLAPGSFPSGPVTAKLLDTSLYTFTPGNQFSPNGILFACTRPLLVEGLTGTALTQPSSTAGTWHAITGSGDWKSYFDSAALYGGGADTQWSTAAGTLNPAVPGSDGSSTDQAGGIYVAWGFAGFSATTHAGGSGAGIGENGTVVAGGLQLSSTARGNIAYALDMAEVSNGQLLNLEGYCSDSSGSSYAYNNVSTDYSGDLTRFYGVWASILPVNGVFSVLGSVPAVTSWAQGGTVTSALLNGNAIGNPLSLLALPPAVRAGAALTTAVANGSVVTVPLGTAQIDSYSAWSPSAHDWTVPLDGVYLVHGMAYFGTATTANVQAGILVNAAALWGPACTAAGSGSTAPQVTRLLDLHAGDVVKLIATTSATGGNSLGNAYPSRLVSLWLSALAPSNGAWSWTPPDTGFRWQAGTPGSALPGLFQQHLTNDLSFLIERPYLLAYQSAPQSGLSQNAFHTITMDTQAGIAHATPGDPYDGWRTGSGGFYEAPVPGWYLVVAGFSQSVPGSTPASCVAGILQTPAGANSPDWYQQVSTTSGSLLPGAEAIGAYYLRAGDTIQPQYQQQDGGTFSTAVTAGHQSSFGAVWISS
jgi:hypothetical protein